MAIHVAASFRQKQGHQVNSSGALGVDLDVRDAGSVSAAVDMAYGMLDGLDMLVNNAGIGMLTVNPRFMTRVAAILGGAAQRLSRCAGDQGNRHVPGRPRGGAANAERRWRGRFRLRTSLPGAGR